MLTVSASSGVGACYSFHDGLLSQSYNYAKESLPSGLGVNVTTHGGLFSIAAKQDFQLPFSATIANNENYTKCNRGFPLTMLSMEGFTMHFTILASRSPRFKTIVMLINHTTAQAALGRQSFRNVSNKNNVCGTGRAM
jgi:hypothetical protein